MRVALIEVFWFLFVFYCCSTCSLWKSFN